MFHRSVAGNLYVNERTGEKACIYGDRNVLFHNLDKDTDEDVYEAIEYLAQPHVWPRYSEDFQETIFNTFKEVDNGLKGYHWAQWVIGNV